MDYYIGPHGRTATFELLNVKTKKRIAKANGKQKGDEPIRVRNSPTGFPEGYPSYEIITVNGITDIIEHRRMEPVFYITDDPAVWSELGVRQ